MIRVRQCRQNTIRVFLKWSLGELLTMTLSVIHSGQVYRIMYPVRGSLTSGYGFRDPTTKDLPRRQLFYQIYFTITVRLKRGFHSCGVPPGATPNMPSMNDVPEPVARYRAR